MIRDKEFLDIFWSLSNESSEKREKSVKDLLSFLEKHEDEEEKRQVAAYTLGRLLKGMKSIRNFARIGFATALTTLLVQRPGDFDQQELLALVKKHLYDTTTDSKGERTALKIGQLFILSVLAKGNRLKDCSSKEVKWLIAPVLPLLAKQDYRPLACKSVAAVAANVPEKVFAKGLLPALEPVLAAGWDAADPDQFLLVVAATAAHPATLDRAWLKQHWGCKRLLAAPAARAPLVRLLERAFEGREGALAAGHPLVAAVVQGLGDSPEALAALWRAAEENVFGGEEEEEAKEASIRAKAALLHFFFEVVLDAKSPAMLEVLSPAARAIQLLHKQLSRREFALHPVAAHFAQSQLPRWAAAADDATASAAFSLFAGADATFDFGLAPTLRLLQPLSGRAAPAALAAHAAALSAAYSEPHPRAERRAFVAGQLRLLVVGGRLPGAAARLALAFLLARLLDAGPGAAEPAGAALFRCLEALSAASCRPRATRPDRYLRRTLAPLLRRALEAGDGPGSPAMRRALQLIGEEEEEDDEPGRRLREMFALLCAHLGLHALADPRGIDALLRDVEACLERAAPEPASKAPPKDDDDQPHWTEVMTDCLLSLLSHNSRLLRSLVKLVFSRMVDQLTPVCSQLLADVLLSRVEQKKKKSVDDDDDEDLLQFDEEEEEEDEGEDGEEATGGEQMDEDEDEDDEDEEEEDEEEEEEDDDDDAAVQALRQRVQSALGPAGMEEEASGDSDMDDDAMFRLDSAIAAAFKASAKATSSKKAMAERRRQLMQLKSKCLDLIEIVLQQSVKPAVIEPCLTACVEVLRRPDEAELKVADIIGSIKKRSNQMIASEQEDVDLISRAVMSLLRSGRKAPPLPKFLSGLASAILFMLKPLPPSAQQPLVQEELRQLVEENSPVSVNLLSILLERNPLLGWYVRDNLLQWTQREDLRNFNRTQAVTILCTVLKFTGSVENQGAFRASCAAVADRLLKNADIWSQPHLARQVTELAFVSLKGNHVKASVMDSLQKTLTAQMTSQSNTNRTVKRGQRRLMAAIQALQRKTGSEEQEVRKGKKRKFSESQ